MDTIGPPENRLFPTKTSFILFWSYISLFVSQGLLVTAVRRSQILGFNTAIVVLLTEWVKLMICLIVYLYRSHGLSGLPALLYDIKANSKLLILYLIPAFLYCLYNNLTFINLELFDLATYYCLMQFRNVLTAVIYQSLFQRKLTPMQWMSLVVLTAGCFLKEYGLYSSISNHHDAGSNYSSLTNGTISLVTTKDSANHEPTQSNPVIKFFWSTALLLLQMFCSCFAGVYNEFLLKDSASANKADVILQNIFMYFDSIICNMFVFMLLPTPEQKTFDSTVETIDLSTSLYNLLTSPLVIILILNNALSGLVASFFLKSLNSILKTFASALELFVVTFLAWILFGNNVDLYTVIAMVLVSAAIIIYSKNPVSVAPPGKVSDSRDGFILLSTNEE